MTKELLITSTHLVFQEIGKRPKNGATIIFQM